MKYVNEIQGVKELEYYIRQSLNTQILNKYKETVLNLI